LEIVDQKESVVTMAKTDQLDSLAQQDQLEHQELLEQRERLD